MPCYLKSHYECIPASLDVTLKTHCWGRHQQTTRKSYLPRFLNLLDDITRLHSTCLIKKGPKSYWWLVWTLLVIFCTWTQYRKSSYPLAGTCSRLSQKPFCFPLEIAPELNSYLSLPGCVFATSHNMVLLKVKLSWSFKGGLRDTVGWWGAQEKGNLPSIFFLYLLNLSSREEVFHEGLNCDLFHLGAIFSCIYGMWKAEPPYLLALQMREKEKSCLSLHSALIWARQLGQRQGGGQIKHKAYVHVRERGTCTQKYLLCYKPLQIQGWGRREQHYVA